MQSTVNRFDQFEKFTIPGGKGVLHRNWAEGLGGGAGLARMLKEPQGDVLRGGGGQGITRRIGVNGRVLFAKYYRPDRLNRRVKDLLGFYRCLREWRANCLAAEAGVACAGVAGAVAMRKGLHVEQCIITEAAAGISTADHLRRLSGDREGIEEHLAALGRYVAQLHRIGFWHAHLSCKHIFRDDAGEFMLIDLERSFLARPLPPSHIARNIEQLTRRLGDYVSPADVDFFQQHYDRALTSPGKPPAAS